MSTMSWILIFFLVGLITINGLLIDKVRDQDKELEYQKASQKYSEEKAKMWKDSYDEMYREQMNRIEKERYIFYIDRLVDDVLYKEEIRNALSGSSHYGKYRIITEDGFVEYPEEFITKVKAEKVKEG